MRIGSSRGMGFLRGVGWMVGFALALALQGGCANELPAVSGEETSSGSSGAESTMAPICGNGIVEAGESCDDGVETATCNANCTLAGCGDGISTQPSVSNATLVARRRYAMTIAPRSPVGMAWSTKP